MWRRQSRLVLAAFALLCGASPAAAQTVVPPYDSSYSIVDLGTVPGLPTKYGGLVFLAGDPNTLLIGGQANGPVGALYAVALVRDVDSRITGFSASATLFAGSPYIDGGVAYGPGEVIFASRYPQNEIGQIKKGSTLTDKVVDLTPLGVSPSIGGLHFVPGGFPGAGQLKVVSYNSQDWYTLDVSADGTGTFDITGATLEATLSGGPEGFAYIPKGSPQFTDFSSVLVSEFSANQISVYQIDANGDPVPATQTSFVTGLPGAEGAAIDPLTGDLLFSTFDGGNRVISVQGFGIPCGNGTLDPGEQCDNNDDCCSSQCQFKPSSAECRPAAGACNPADFCTGASSSCPADTKSTAECRPAAGPCDVSEFCDGTSDDCPADQLASSGTECRAVAGLCDVAEHCDGATADCPADASVLDGTACDDGNTCTTQDECSAGVCAGTSFQTCGPCRSCDPAGACHPALWSACRQPIVPGKSRLLVKNKSADKKDGITWKWLKGALTALEDFGDPQTTTDYAVCLYDEGGVAGSPRALLRATIPAAGTCKGKPCWKPAKKGRFKYKDKELTPDGIKLVVLKPGEDGKAGVVVKGKGEYLGLPPALDMTGTVTVQLQATNGECWEAVYRAAIASSSTKFKAKSD